MFSDLDKRASDKIQPLFWSVVRNKFQDCTTVTVYYLSITLIKFLISVVQNLV